MNAVALVLLTTITVPPAAKVLAVVAVIYPLIQGLKKIPALTPYLKGWWAIALNVALTICGDLIVVPADQLYTTNTLLALVTGALASAGVHGTISSLLPPTVLATIPPDPQVKEVPATLEPVNPAAVPVPPTK
jgi:hypothetical protein